MTFTRLFSCFVFQDIKSNKLRTLLSITGIALGVTVMLAVSLANKTAVMRFKENVNLISGNSNMHVLAATGDELDETILEKLQFLWGEDVEFTPVIEDSVVLAGSNPDLIQIIGVDLFADSAFRQRNEKLLELDSVTSLLSNNSALAGKDFVQKHHLTVGDKINVLVNDRMEEIKIVDTIDNASFGKAYGGNLLLMDIGPAQNLFSRSGKITRVEIIVKEIAWSALSRKLNNTLPPGLLVERPADRSLQLEKMTAAFQSNLTALSVIALLVGAFLVYNTMSISVIRKRPEIGILRALGADKLLIFNLFLAQIIFIGVIGSALGVVFGCILAQSALSAVSKTVEALYIGQPQAQVQFDLNLIFSCFFTGTVMTFLAALGPLLEAMNVNPAESMKSASNEPRTIRNSKKLAAGGATLLLMGLVCAKFPAVNSFPLFGYVSAALVVFGLAFCLPLLLKMFFAAVKPLIRNIEISLSISALSGSLSRTCVAVAGLMLGIAMMTSMVIMISSFRNTVTVWVEQTLKADLFIESKARSLNSRNAKLSEELLSKIKETTGVEDVDVFVHFPLKFQNRLTNLGSGNLKILEKRGNLLFTDNEKSADVLARVRSTLKSCIVTESFAERFHLKKGDTVTIETAKGKLDLLLQGIYFDYASDLGYIIIARELQEKYFPSQGSSSCAVYLSKNISPDLVRENIIKNIGTSATSAQINILTHSGLKAEVLRVFDNTFAITYALHAISIAVAIIGVANTVLAIVLEMRKDFSILRFVGASMSEIKKIILIQSTMLGFLGALMGIMAGLALSLILIHVINKQSFGWTVQMSLPYLTLLQSFLLIVFTSFLSGFIPALAASKIVTSGGVRAE